GPGGGRRAPARARRGDRALDDAAGAPAPARDRRLAPAADRARQRHERPAGEPAARGPQADGEDDEAARQGQAACASGHGRAEWAGAAGPLGDEEAKVEAQEEVEIEITEVTVWLSS